MKEQVDILLATYQGQAFLEELLESLFTQTYHPIHIIARDDCSQDDTLKILEKWKKTFPNNMTIISSEKNSGIKKNFSELIKHSQAPYIMFADQDDKWLPFKVEESLEEMKAMERQFDSHHPLLVHTDLKVVDRQLNEIAPSFWTYAGLNPEKGDINHLLPQNCVTGCTLLMNRNLAELVYPIPIEALMHDWWIALTAACFGHIRFLQHPTILYRQHQQNDLGACHYSVESYLKKQLATTRNKKVDESTCVQAQQLLKQHKKLFFENDEKRTIVEAYAKLNSLSYLQQLILIFKYRFFKQGFLRNIKFLLSKTH